MPRRSDRGPHGSSRGCWRARPRGPAASSLRRWLAARPHTPQTRIPTIAISAARNASGGGTGSTELWINPCAHWETLRNHSRCQRASRSDANTTTATAHARNTRLGVALPSPRPRSVPTCWPGTVLAKPSSQVAVARQSHRHGDPEDPQSDGRSSTAQRSPHVGAGLA